MSSSSDDDDVPLSALANGKRSRPKDDDSSEAEFDDEASDGPAEEEEDIDDFIIAEEEGDDDDDDDEDVDYDSDDSDDIPLSALKSPPSKKKAANKPAAKSKATKTKAAPKKKATSAKKKKKSTTTKKTTSKPAAAPSSSYVSASTELYAKCDKGKLIQSLLARWWYVYTWPDPAALKATPKGYDALAGFPGVYICTSGGNVGKFKDDRDHSKAPSFQNFAKKTSEELRGDLLKAIEKQMTALIKAEGEGTETEKELKTLEKWATKLNCSKTDKDAVKVLKGARLTV